MTIPLTPLLTQILGELRAAGFRTLVVGGAVRDALLLGEATGNSAPAPNVAEFSETEIKIKDIDIELYGISYERLAAMLAPHGYVDLVGKKFGVIKFTAPSGETCDFSVPRRDNKVGLGHRDFHTVFDENITPREAASRRDFTINAIAFDPATGELLDFFGGQADLANRVLRATSDAFSEDPLRVLRGMQFACRFDLSIDPATAALSRSIVSEYSTLPKERVAEEFMRWATKAARPGRIAEYLQATGWIVHFPEIGRLEGVPQDPIWHPEGDVGTHTMHVVNEAARIASRDRISGDERAVLLFAALSHDFAKATTTELRERDGVQRWTSWGHEPAGGPMARAFLERIGIKSAIIDQVQPLVENHLAASSIGRHVTARGVRRLAIRLAPSNITQLLRLIEADYSGRPPLPRGLPESAVQIREMAAAQAVEQRPQPPLILGRHVLPYFDNRPGKHIGEVTHAAYEAQADGLFSTEDEARQWLEDHMGQYMNGRMNR